MTLELREWQRTALERWRDAGRRGIVEVVTGGGKTFFALACIKQEAPGTTLIVVPTLALVDQWWEEAASVLGMRLEDIEVVSGKKRVSSGTVNIAVLNTAARLQGRGTVPPCFLIVDECHRAASAEFRQVLSVPTFASLGLSATPDRQYDDWFESVLVPALGPKIFQYTYREALRDGVIVPFELRNVVFNLEPERQLEYERLTKSIARNIQRYGMDADEVVSLLLRRTRVVNLSQNRVELTLRIAAAHRASRLLIFHEDIEACEVLYEVLQGVGLQVGLYHSRQPLRERANVLAKYRGGDLTALVTCRSLDEGFNVPETEVGIIAASTATLRQRIQRLGRILRPARGKDSATVYTLAATKVEVSRLEEEEERLEGVATVNWSHA